MPIPPDGKPVRSLDPEIAALLSDGDEQQVEIQADEQLDAELGSRFLAAEAARKDIEEEMRKSLYRRNGKYMPDVLASLKKSGGSKTFSNITEGKCASAEANFVNLILFSASRAWGIEATPIPELSGEATDEVARRAFEQVGEIEGEEFEAVSEQIAESIKADLSEEADQRAEKMQKLIDDQFAQGGWRDATLDVLHDFCTLEIAGWMGPVPKVVRERRVERGALVYVEKIVPSVMRLDPFGIFPAALAKDAAEGDFFYRVMISDDAAVEIGQQPNLLEGRYKLAYGRKGTRVGANDTDQLVAQEIQRQQDAYGTSTAPDGTHELIYWWHKMTRREAAGVRREELDPDQMPEERVSFMGLMLNGVVISCEENWDPSGKPQIHLCCFRRNPGSPFGKSLPWLNKDPQNERNVAIRALHTNMMFSARPMLEASLDRLTNAWDVKTIYPGKVITTKPMGADNRQALTMLAVPNFTAQMLAAANQAVEWSHDATGISPQAYGAHNQTGPAETMGGYEMLREDQMTVLKLAIISLDQAIRSLVDSFWTWNMLTEGHDECKGDSRVVARGAVQLFLSSESVNGLQAKIQFFIEHPDLAAQALLPNGLLRMIREWLTLSNMDPDRYTQTEEQADESRQMQEEQAAAEAAAAEAEAAAGGAQPPPAETESDRMKAQADMIRAQAAQKKAEIEEGKLAIARADATVRAMKARREDQQAQAAAIAAAGRTEEDAGAQSARGSTGA